MKNKDVLLHENSTLNTALMRMNNYGFKSLVILKGKAQYAGILSDGDIRKSLVRGKKLKSKISDIYKKKTIFFEDKKCTLEIIKKTFIKKQVDVIPVIDENKNIKKIFFYSDINKIKIKTKKNYPRIPHTTVVIMSGGKGTRLKPYTNVLPKPLIPFKGKTLIEHVVGQFTDYKINKFIFSINYKSHLIKAFFKELQPNYFLEYVEETTPLGSAGSLNKIKKSNQKYFFISTCDTIIKTNYHKVYKNHLKQKNDITIIAANINFKLPYGVCNIDKKNLLNEFKEKPNLNYIVNTGIYLINSKIINLIPRKNSFYHMTDLIDRAKKLKKRVGVFTIKEEDWTDLGKISNLQNLKL